MPVPYVPCPGVARATFVGLVAAQPVINRIHFRKDTNWTAANLAELAETLYNWWDTNIKGIVTTNGLLERVDTIDLADQHGPSGSYTDGALVGTVSGTPAQNSVAICATLRTASRGRSFRGRWYQGGLAMSQIASPLSCTDAFATALRTALESLMVPDSIFTGATWGVLTTYSGGNWRSEGFTTDITSVTVDTLLDSQRRRLAN